MLFPSPFAELLHNLIYRSLFLPLPPKEPTMFKQAAGMVRDVALFHTLYGHPLRTRIEGFPPDDRVELRKNLVLSEAAVEFPEAVEARNIVETADAIADSIFVLIGTAHEFGIDLERVWNLVVISNLCKLFTPTQARAYMTDHPGSSGRVADDRMFRLRLSNEPDFREYVSLHAPAIFTAVGNGEPLWAAYNELGKTIKPPGWEAPDIRLEIFRQMSPACQANRDVHIWLGMNSRLQFAEWLDTPAVKRAMIVDGSAKAAVYDPATVPQRLNEKIPLATGAKLVGNAIELNTAVLNVKDGLIQGLTCSKCNGPMSPQTLFDGTAGEPYCANCESSDPRYVG